MKQECPTARSLKSTGHSYIYNILYPYSQVTEETKRKHIQKIKELEDHTNSI